MPNSTPATPNDKNAPASAARFWPDGWWKLMEFRVGIIPLPVYFLLLALIAGFIYSGALPTEINVMIAVLAVGGFTCGEIGRRLPVLRHVGAAAIFATFI
ncbi:MAG: 2-hydroxycarboxylate transporter family protein, partial [Rudaea sp.]